MTVLRTAGLEGERRARAIGWLLSCSLHGGLIVGSILFVQQVRLAPQPKPFVWNVALISPEQAVEPSSPLVPQVTSRAEHAPPSQAREPITRRPMQIPERAPVVPKEAEPPQSPSSTIAAVKPPAPLPSNASSPSSIEQRKSQAQAITVPPQVKPQQAPEPIPTTPLAPPQQTIVPEPAATPLPARSDTPPEMLVTSPSLLDQSHGKPVQEPMREPSPPSPVQSAQPAPPLDSSTQIARTEPLPSPTMTEPKTEVGQPLSAPLAPTVLPNQELPSGLSESNPVSKVAPSQLSGPTSARFETASAAPARIPAPTRRDYGWLSEMIVRRIEELKRYPMDARLEQAQGKVVVKVVISEDGSVHDTQVVKSSGFRILDEAAVSLMREAGPFELPHPLGKPSLTIRVPINYSLDRQ